MAFTPPRPLAACLAFLLLAAAPRPGSAQNGEPILEEARAIFSQPGMTFRFLARINVDAGLEDAVTRATANQARLRVEGKLDGGFNYLVQTNYGAATPLLDARVGWSQSPAFAFTAGRFKTPYSDEFLVYVRDIDFVYRSRVVADLAPNRQVGVQVSGRAEDILDWSLGGFSGRRNTSDGEPLLGVMRLRGTGIQVGDGTLQVAAQAALGQDAAVAPVSFGTDYSGSGRLFGLDARYEAGPLLLAGEIHDGRWSPTVGADRDAAGLYLTAGWMVAEDRQILARWDRYRSPLSGTADDVLVLGFNAWPTRVATFQVNWSIPLRDSAELHRLLFTFQMGN